MSFNPQLIEGKWNRKRYQVHQELGRGTTGIVYLVTNERQAYALKLGEDTLSISAEVNILKKFQGSNSPIVGPAVFDVDDWQEGEKTRPFYVMNVIEGKSLHAFVQERGREWVPVLMMQLLDFLEALHQAGFVFGDLKPENLKVSGHPPRLAWFDPGGITKIGWAIKEYTPGYDRACWHMGDRKAEPAYDLFSLALIFLFLYTGKTIQPDQLSSNLGSATQDVLKTALYDNKCLAPYQELLWKAVSGQYREAQQMKTELLKHWFAAKQRSTKQATHGLLNKQHKGQKASASSLKPKAKRGIVSTMITFFFLSSFFIFLFALYLFSQTL